jgi:exopolysaccharide biosynthesis predicted pyruvyltransferase EpsI
MSATLTKTWAPAAERRSAATLVASLKAEIAACFGAYIPAGPVALLDFPDHSNVGDSAIWLGEMAWLDQAGRRPAYSAALGEFSADELLRAAPHGPILIHGGGNFGTLWSRHEEFRLLLLRRFPGRPIVQLPQSIHYSDPARALEMAEAIRAHGAFTLLVRDADSLDFARRHFECETRLCPDAALYLGSFERKPATVDILALLRNDRESVAEGPVAMPPGTLATDWPTEDGFQRKLLRSRLKLDSLFAFTTQGKRLRRHRMLANWRLRRGLATLSKGKVVVTDRLHAHILSLLLDIPHVALDNTYGKVAAFAAQWTEHYRGFYRAQSRAAAFQHASALAKEL